MGGCGGCDGGKWVKTFMDSSPFPPILDFLIGSCLKKKVQLFNKACVAKSTG